MSRMWNEGKWVRVEVGRLKVKEFKVESGGLRFEV